MKIFSIEDDCVIENFKRGSTRSEIYDMVFTHDDKYLAVMSKPNGTIHIFKLAIHSERQKISDSIE